MSASASRVLRVAMTLGVTLVVLVPSVQAQQIIKKGAVTGVKVAHEKNNAKLDFASARAIELPRATEADVAQAQQDLIMNLVNPIQSATAGDSGQVEGSMGDGTTETVDLDTPSTEFAAQNGLEVEPAQFGTSNHPFSTARADLSSATNTMYPYRASGKLYFTVPGQGNFVCSAALIKRGVAVTAAHCVTQYASKQFYTNFQFVPGLRGSSRPYGTWTVATAWVTTAYLNGATGQCDGAICKDDVAVLELTPQSGAYPGTRTGWYGYGWNRWGVTSNGFTHITQIGYPVSHNSGLYMMRNDSQGFVGSSTLKNNTIIGSLMTGGSSGGPWLNNFGYLPSLSGTSFGSFSTPNMVVGVTSWVYTNTAIKEMGASPFSSTNIVPLVNSACAGSDPRCS
ncbi:MAG TPA: trypsin-like serine protease [Nitrospira sp.]|nr:trypsin-like serine protease [Nitrospira sp.]